MTSKTKELLNVARANKRNIWDVCAAILQFIFEQAEAVQQEYFFVFLTEIEVQDICGEDYPHFISKDTLSNLPDNVIALEKQVVKNLVQKSGPTDEFYRNLWERLHDGILLPDETAQTTFLMLLWLDSRIPYYQIGEGCMMDDEEFATIRQSISPVLKQADFILSAPFRQKTQWASLLATLADGIENEREKAVFWAVVITKASIKWNYALSEKTDSREVKAE